MDDAYPASPRFTRDQLTATHDYARPARSDGLLAAT